MNWLCHNVISQSADNDDEYGRDNRIANRSFNSFCMKIKFFQCNHVTPISYF